MRVQNQALDDVVPPNAALSFCQFIFARKALVPLGCIYVSRQEPREVKQISFSVAIDPSLAHGGGYIFDALYGTFEHMLNTSELSRTVPPEEKEGILIVSFALGFECPLKEYQVTRLLLSLGELVIAANEVAIAAMGLEPK